MKSTSPFFQARTPLDSVHPHQQDRYGYKELKQPAKSIRLILDSNANDEDIDSIWTNLRYDLYKMLPNPKISELMAADRFTFTLESIAWTGKSQYTSPFIMTLNISNDTVYGNKNRQVLKILKNEYEQFNADPGFGITTTDKSWLQSGHLQVSFKSMLGSQLSDQDFDLSVATSTKYVASIILHYE